MFPVASNSNNKNDIASVDKIDTSDERKAFDHVDDNEKKDDKSGEDKTDKSTKDDKSDEDETEEIDETETEDEDEEDEDEEGDETLASDSVYQSLKKVDKDIFKKVPELRHIIFREAEYSKHFSTVEEAAEAVEAVDTFNDFQRDLTNGNSEKLLVALEKTDKKALESFVANFIPTLEKQNKQLYYDMIFPEFKKLFRYAARSQDENIQNSAAHLHNLIFGDTDFNKEAGLKAKSEEKDEREEKLTKREQEIEEKNRQGFTKNVFNAGHSRIIHIISSAFKNTDINPLFQKSLTNEIFQRVDAALQKDTRHMGEMNRLWQQAGKDGYTREWEDRIINTYLSRAKLLIAPTRQKVLAEAKLSVKMNEEGERKLPKRIPSSASSSNQSRGKIDSKKIDWNKVTDERALLDGNIPMKK